MDKIYYFSNRDDNSINIIFNILISFFYTEKFRICECRNTIFTGTAVKNFFNRN